MLKISVSNDFNQLDKKSNCISFRFKSPAISPSKESPLDASTISSYSSFGNHTVIITNEGEIFVAGDNRYENINGLYSKQKFTKFTKIDIQDNDGNSMYPISAVCSDICTLYLVSPSKNSDETRVALSVRDKNKNIIFLDIKKGKPVSLFGGRGKAAIINSDDSISFIQNMHIKFELSLPDDEKLSSIACCTNYYYVASLSGRVFKLSGIPNQNETIPNFELVESLKRKKITEVSGTCEHCLAVSEDGRVFGYGQNTRGQLGIGEETRVTDDFVEITSLNEHKIIHAYAGTGHSLFQTAEGKILACGLNLFGELLTSQPSKNPVYLPIETEITHGATFCVAGTCTSSIFIGHDPLKSPNCPVNIEKVQVPQPQNAPSPEEVSQLKEKISQLENILFLTSQQPNSQSKSEENYFIDSDIESEFHTDPFKISEGGTSITYKVIDTRTMTPICKKVLKYRKGQTSIKDAKNAIKEFEVLYGIHHPCICKAYGINMQELIDVMNDDDDEEETTTIALFLEFLDYPLSDILKKKISSTSKARIVLDICHAMNFLHKHNMMHRDLKIENIMLNSFFETKLVDFGLVKISESVIDDFSFIEDSKTKGIGTFAYMSPEMANEEDYTDKTDVYSFGVVLHFIFTGNLPKQSLKEKVIGKKIQLPSPSKSISKFCIKLIENCLSYDPEKRPSFEDILVQLRKNSYQLAAEVDPTILSRRDKELEFIENYK